VDGIDIMRERRPRAKTDFDLTNGPGKLTAAFGIDRSHNGADLTRGPLTVRTPKTETPFDIEVTPRIGLTKCADRPLRFLLKR
jgi:DNA-3-methyladenine glycosylase